MAKENNKPKDTIAKGIRDWLIAFALAAVIVTVAFHFSHSNVVVTEFYKNSPFNKLNPPPTRTELSKFQLDFDSTDWRISHRYGTLDEEWVRYSNTFDSSNAALEHVVWIIGEERANLERTKKALEAQPAPTLDQVFMPPTVLELQQQLQAASNMWKNVQAQDADTARSQLIEMDYNIQNLRQAIAALQESKQDKPPKTNIWDSVFFTNNIGANSNLIILTATNMAIRNYITNVPITNVYWRINRHW